MTELQFLGSNPAGYSEWRCNVCGVEFSLRWDGHAHDEKAIPIDPWLCPYCLPDSKAQAKEK